MSCKRGLKTVDVARSRPLLGTFVTIRGTAPDGDATHVNEALTRAFAEVERLQKIFSVHDPESILNRYNSREPVTLPGEWIDLVHRAKDLQRRSENYFWPYLSKDPASFDLSGIAKGFIVDHLAQQLIKQAPNFSGVINAGGDLRFVGDTPRAVSVRLGSIERPLLKEVWLKPPHVAFASSSMNVAMKDPASSTRYRLALAHDVRDTHTVCVSAREAWVADGLTKVGLHAPAELADRVARGYEASMVVFDAGGTIVAVRGEA